MCIRDRAEAGAHFCGDLVAACVFMYFLSATYALTIALRSGMGGGFAAEMTGGGVTDGFAGSTGYNDLDAAAKADMRPPGPPQMNI